VDKIEAKTIIKGQYWILHQNKKKVGQVTQEPSGYQVRINGKHAVTFKDLESLQKVGLFNFVDFPKVEHVDTDVVHDYPADGIAYNPMWNIAYGLPLYTKTPDSKSWYAAGYYRITIKDKTSIEFCPKLITLQRNKYVGPFKEKPALLSDELFEEV
jgi:hypothetical protein